jgi:hypothetical protein
MAYACWGSDNGHHQLYALGNHFDNNTNNEDQITSHNWTCNWTGTKLSKPNMHVNILHIEHLDILGVWHYIVPTLVYILT